jgi:PAT family beta-lactamase induction signal transducer AmpG
LWLRQAGLDRSTVTLFSWAGLAYGFKFVWAPIIDKMPLPWLTARMGRRRAWLLVAQGAIVCAIAWMALSDPLSSVTTMALGAVLLGFSAATQDIVIDAYRIESAEQELQALMASTYIVGYRLGMLVAGAGALKLVAWAGGDTGAYSYSAWQGAYLGMALAMGVGIVTTLVIPEPPGSPHESRYLHTLDDYLRFLALFMIMVGVMVAAYLAGADTVGRLKQLSAEAGTNGLFSGFLVEAGRLGAAFTLAWVAGRGAVHLGVARVAVLRETYLDPLTDFFGRYGVKALVILSLIGVYRVSDIVMGVIANVFYEDMGFSLDEIANVTEIFGMVAMIFGGLLGGGLVLRYGVMKILFLGALLSAATNLLFMLLAQLGPDIWMLALVIFADNTSGGLASGAFVAYLSGLTRIKFTAFQYALFSSLMLLLPKLLGGYSGAMVDNVGYSSFFLLTALLGLPVLGLVWVAARYAPAGRPVE